MTKILKFVLPLVVFGMMPFAANSQMLPGKHPGYLHALTDLRAARWYLYHPKVDINEHGSRLLKSIETLHAARADIEHEEDNPEVRELRHRALEHIDRAIGAADRAHSNWLKEAR